MRPLLSDNEMWEDFGNRALLLAGEHGADFGECVTTVQRVGAGDAITAPKVLVPFTAAEGSGMHCEVMTHTLYDQRLSDWLDQTPGVRR